MHYIRDAFVRSLHAATGNNAPAGKFFHLYINGLYWGMYEAAEKLDANHMAQYFGGDEDEWDVVKDGSEFRQLVAVDGSIAAWNETIRLARAVSRADSKEAETAAFHRLQGLNPDGTNNPNWESFLDVDSYIDYLIVTLYTKNGGWPRENFVMARRRGPESTGFKFLMWDNEFSLDKGWQRSISKIGSIGPGLILDALRSNEDFRVRFSDRMQRVLEPGGALYVNPDSPIWNPLQPDDNRPASIYAQLVDQVRSPLVPESARWNFGFTVNRSFQRTVDRNFNLFRERETEFVEDIANADLYRQAPRLIPTPGISPAGSQIEIVAFSGQAYYTLDGTDPRNPDGSVSENAQRYFEAVRVSEGEVMLARSLDDTRWSAIASQLADFIPLSTDINGDGNTDIRDVDALCSAIIAGDGGVDFNQDDLISLEDVAVLLEFGLHTNFGDANLDGVFNSLDWVSVFIAGEFEDDTEQNSTWSEGDWNCDGEFSSGDFVQAFQTKGYTSELTKRRTNANSDTAFDA